MNHPWSFEQEGDRMQIVSRDLGSARRGRRAAWVISVLALLGGACNSGGDPVPVDSLHLPCQALRTTSSQADRRPRPLAGTLRIYLDVSEPIGGFLPFDDRERSGFKLVVQSLPGHLSEAFGGGRQIDLQWKGVSDGPPADLKVSRISRDRFQGKESRLDLAIQAMIRDVENGAEGAALITDLVATGPLTGAMGVANALDPPFAQAVQDGRYELGLLGVRAPYWGVKSKHCKGPNAGLGCWFSELKPGYQPLTKPAKVPFYIFLIGRAGGGVENLGMSLQKIAGEQKLETRWELLSRSAYLPQLDLACKAALLTDEGTVDVHRRQVTLVADRAGFRCQRSEKVELSCVSPFALGPAVWAPSGTGKSPWQEAVRFSSKARPGALGLALTIDCDKLPDHRNLPEPPPFRMEVRRSLRASWEDWSSESDERETDLGRTLQLKLFIERARLAPPSFTVLCGPLRPAAPIP